MGDFEKLREAISGDGIFRAASDEELEDRGVSKDPWPPFIEINRDLWKDTRGNLVDTLGEPVIRKGDILALRFGVGEHQAEYTNDVLGDFWFRQGQRNWFTGLQNDPYDEPEDVDEALSPDIFKPASKEEQNKRQEEIDSTFNGIWQRVVAAFNTVDRDETYGVLDSLFFSALNDMSSIEHSDFLNKVDSQLSKDDPGYPFTLADVKLISRALGGPIEINGDM